jgi:hypothetical protein
MYERVCRTARIVVAHGKRKPPGAILMPKGALVVSHKAILLLVIATMVPNDAILVS